VIAFIQLHEEERAPYARQNTMDRQ
jgi:hypothetical protein